MNQRVGSITVNVPHAADPTRIGMLVAQDPKTGCWWQIMPARDGGAHTINLGAGPPPAWATVLLPAPRHKTALLAASRAPRRLLAAIIPKR